MLCYIARGQAAAAREASEQSAEAMQARGPSAAAMVINLWGRGYKIFKIENKILRGLYPETDHT